MSWAFFLLFAIISLLPLSSVFRPETSLLATEHGNLIWWTAQNGKRSEEASVPIADIRKVVKYSQPGTRLVEIELVLADGTVLILPHGLLLTFSPDKIIGSIKRLSPAAEIEEGDATAEPPKSRSGGAAGPRSQPRHSSATAKARKAGSAWQVNGKNAWKFTLCFVVMGVALMGAAVPWGISTYQFIHAASQADGTIVQIQIVDSPAHRFFEHQYTIAFTDRSGTVRTFTENGSNRQDFTFGQRVRVAYDANDPSIARIIDFRFLWLPQTFIGTLGLCIFVLGSWATFQVRKHPQQ